MNLKRGTKLNTLRFNRALCTTELLEPRRLLAIAVDPSFGNNGIARAIPGADGVNLGTVMVREVAGGKVLTVSAVDQLSDQGGLGVDAVLTRFNADGSADLAFGGGDGISVIGIGTRVTDADLQPDGKVVIVGLGDDPDTLVVARVTAGGAPDSTFGGGDGVAEMNFPSAPFEGPTASSVAVAPDGTIVAGGTLLANNDTDLLLARFTSTGTPATNFGGGDGVAIVDRPNNVDQVHVAVDESGRVLVLMREDNRSIVGRFTATGTADAAFSGDGFVTLPPAPHGEFPASIAVAPDGVGAVVGVQGFVAWLTESGEPHAAFSGDGVAPLPEAIRFADVPTEIRVDALARVVGVVSEGAFRLLPDGSPDPAFGTGGVVPIAGMDSNAIAVSTGNSDVLLVGGRLSGGTSTVTAARLAQRPTVALGPFGILVVTGSDADDTVTIDAAGNEARLDFNGVVTTYPLADVTAVNVDAGAGDNTITLALDLDATIRAAAGDDTIASAGGHDTIHPGDGANVVSTSDGINTVIAGAGDDSITGGDGPDIIGAGSGRNTIFGGGGNDDIVARDGDDSIDGGPGNDTVAAASGNNTLAGGDGDDLLVGGDGHDAITGGDGDDTLLGGHGDNVLFGGTGNDYLKTGDGADTLWGEIGNDELRGGFGNDYLNGGASKDRLFGQQGNDILYGGRNNDALDGGPGSDLLKGWDGDDKLFDRDDAADALDGGAGTDLGIFDEEPLDTVLRIETVL